MIIGADIKNLLDEDCSICLEPLASSNFCLLSCNHYYHEKCIKKWFNHRPFCPLCSRAINLSNIVKFYEINNKINEDNCVFYRMCWCYC